MRSHLHNILILVLLVFLIQLGHASSPTLPANVVSYIPITFTNYQSTALAANTPIAIGTVNSITGNIIGFPANSYQQYETCNLNNAEFFLANGVVINSWMEGNILNELAANALCTSASSVNALAASSNVLWWVEYPWPSSFLPANTGTFTQNTIYLGFAGNALTTANNLLSNTITGEAPQLSSSYGQYDNGANVFTYYQSWGGLSALPTNYASITNTVVTFNPTYATVAPPASTGGWYGVYLTPLPSGLSGGTAAWDVYGNIYDSINAGSYVGTTQGQPGNFDGYAFSEGDTATNTIYLANAGQFISSTSTNDINTNKVYTLLNSGTSVNMFLNYSSIFSSTTATSEAPTYFVLAPSKFPG